MKNQKQMLGKFSEYHFRSQDSVGKGISLSSSSPKLGSAISYLTLKNQEKYFDSFLLNIALSKVQLRNRRIKFLWPITGGET